MNLSILIPLLNEEESLNELYTWIIKVMQTNNYSYEIIFLDDGSTDNSWHCIEQFAKENPHVKGIRFMKNFGKSQALHAGFAKAQGDVIITMDADLQDSPEEIPGLYDMITNGNFDLVSGWKKKRYDSIMAKNLPSKLFNWAARKTSGVYLNDFNCGLKAYKLSVVKSIELYGDMHRYVPALAKYAGFQNIGEKIVQHQARKYGVTKFGLNRFLNGPLDLMTVAFMGKFGKKPMHFFGGMGTLMFLIGFGLLLYLGLDKLLFHKTALKLAERSEFYVSLAAMIIGVQFFLVGFVSELIGRNSSTRNQYLIEKQISE